MPDSRAAAALARTPETERCAFCLQTYAYEMAVRCQRCDLPACGLCAVRVRGSARLVCPDCHRAPDGPARPARGR